MSLAKRQRTMSTSAEFDPSGGSLARAMSNSDQAGDEQGLFNVDFAIKETEGLRRQAHIDRELSELWTSHAISIMDTTRETVGAKYDEFTGERFDLVAYASACMKL